MKAGRCLFMTALLFFLLPMTVHGREPDKEDVVKGLCEIAGYREGERTIRMVCAEFEPGGQTGCFLTACCSSDGYAGVWNDPYSNEAFDDRVVGNTDYFHDSGQSFGDVWAFMDGVYTPVFTDVELWPAGECMDLLEMEGRSFVLIRLKNNVYLYSFRGEEPTRFLQPMADAGFDHQKKILTAYFESLLGTYENGELSYGDYYTTMPYFFNCEEGELQELTAEPCAEEEFMREVRSPSNAKRDAGMYGYGGLEKETRYYRIPGIAHYMNIVCWGPGEAHFGQVMQMDDNLYSKENLSNNGYRCMSWQNRTEEELAVCRELAPLMGEDLSQRISYLEKVSGWPGRLMVVRKGDSLCKIAERVNERTEFNGVPGIGWAELYEWNKDVVGDNPSLIYPGMALRYVNEAGDYRFMEEITGFETAAGLN